MSHEIIKPIDLTFSTKGTEWHGLAEQVEKITAEFLKERGVFFPIKQGTVLNSLTDGESFSDVIARCRAALVGNDAAAALAALDALGLAQISTHKNIIADMRGIRPDLENEENAMGLVPLHVSRKTYEVIDNETVFNVISNAFANCPITSAGTLQAAQVFFMSLDIGDNQRKGPRGDVYMQNLNALTSHNGTLGTRFFDSNVRMVCMNTVRASLSNRGLLDFVVYHTKGAHAALDTVSNDLTLVMQARNEFFDGLGLLDTVACTAAQARALYVAYTLYLAETKAATVTNDGISTQVFNRADEIGSLFVRGKGNAGANLYDAWNALTDCFSNGVGAGKTATKEDKFLSGMFGTAADIKEGYLPFLLQSSDIIAGQIERGEKALTEYARLRA